MKMNRSIKDYREAMDNIRISDSFYKRTEALLTELPEINIEKKPALSPKKITAFLSAAAACLLIAFGVRFAAARHTDNVEITAEEGSSVSEITETYGETGTNTASPVIDDLDGGEGFEEEMAVGIAEDAEDIEHDEAERDEAETSVTAQTTESMEASPETAAAESAAPASGGVETKTASAPEPEETVPLLNDISYEHVTVEITPYFNMGTIKSGEGAVKVKGTDCKEIIEFIAGITESSKEIGNYSFTSLFSLQISDENIGLTFYSIYITDLNAVVITKHDSSGQIRATYGVNASDYEAIKHILFLRFGTEEDYELFSSLVSGK